MNRCFEFWDRKQDESGRLVYACLSFSRQYLQNTFADLKTTLKTWRKRCGNLEHYLMLTPDELLGLFLLFLDFYSQDNTYPCVDNARNLYAVYKMHARRTIMNTPNDNRPQSQSCT